MSTSKKASASIAKVCIAIAPVVIANGICVAGVSQLDYDEGVYWQTLRAMRAGYHLYGEIFCSQPPLFLLSIFPFYVLLGSTIISARIGVATLSLFALPGAYLMGKALAGRAGGIVAVVLLIFTPAYLAQSQILQAEGPATAFLFLTIGAALYWWQRPTGRRGMAAAVLGAVALTSGILIKLIDVTAIVPILLLVLARIWPRRETSPSVWASVLPILTGIVAAVIVTLIVLAPFLHSINALVQQVVTLHLVARKVTMFGSESDNAYTLGRFFAANGTLSAASIIGAILAVVRRDGRIIPLLAWFLITLIFLIVQVPFFVRHAIVLIPPLIGIIVLGLKDLPTITIRRPIAWQQNAALLIGLVAVATVAVSIRQDYKFYRDLHAQAMDSANRERARIAADLKRVTTSDQWIITDGQFVAALATRDTPPWLVDTSYVRVLSGYLTTGQLLQAGANARVHAAVFADNRLSLAPVAGFHAWIAERFNLLHTYDTGTELWVR